MTYLKTLLIAAPVALGMLAAPAAHAEWRGGGGDHRGGGWDHRGGHYEGHRGGRGFPVVGALLGLGAAAVVGGIIASQQPVYAPPSYYPPQPYYQAPAYYQSPAYYGAPYYAR